MRFAQVRILVLVVAGSLLAALTASRPAAAQCMPDPPTGSSATEVCGGDDAPTPDATAGATIFRLPFRVFIQNPVVATMSWMALRHQATILERVTAMKRRGFTTRTLRGGRSLKQGRVVSVD